jgi:hypothetical protein
MQGDHVALEPQGADGEGVAQAVDESTLPAILAASPQRLTIAHTAPRSRRGAHASRRHHYGARKSRLQRPASNQKALAEACQRAEDGVPELLGELLATQAEIAKAERAMERYLAAFEDGSLSASGWRSAWRRWTSARTS